MILVLYCVLHILTVTRCSIVFDVNNQGALVNKYCKAIGNCLPGQHVLCMYGDSETVMGPRCGEGQIINLTKSEAQYTLDVMNGSKLARGKETGKYNQPLPRGYSIRRLDWSDDLALFAHVWANQCDQRMDYCRSTEDFPNAGQALSIYQFKYPNWELEEYQFKDKTPKLTAEKRKYVIDYYLNQLYNQKTSVTDDMIQNAKFSGIKYLMMVQGGSTNVGCAMSTYVEYYESEPELPVIYYTVQFVCNFSNQPRANEKVYETSTAQGVGWTPCGCSLDFEEDDQCLCVRSESNGNDENGNDDKPKEKGKTSDQNGENSKGKGDNSKGKGDNYKKKGDNSNGKGNDSNKKGNNSKGKGDDSNKKGNNSNEKGDDSKKQDDNSKGKGDDSKNKGNNSKEKSGDSKNKDDNSKEKSDDSNKKGNNFKEKGDNSNKKGNNSKEKDDDSKKKGDNSKGKGYDSNEKGNNSKEKGDDSKNKGNNSKENGDDSNEKGNDSKEKSGDSKNKGDNSKEKGDDSNKKGNNFKEKGDNSNEKGNNSKEKDDDSKKKGDNSKGKGGDSKKKGSNSKEKGDDSNEKGNNSKEKGDDSKKKGNDSKEKGDDSNEKDNHSKGKNDDSKKKGNNSKEKGDVSKEKDKYSKEKGDSSQENSGKKHKDKIPPVSSCAAGDQRCKSPVVVMPIFKVENANSEMLQQEQGLEKPSMTTLGLRKEQIRQRIRDRVEDVRDRYFSENIHIEPGTRFSNGGEVDEGDFAMSTFDTEPYAIPNLNHRESTRYNFPTKIRPNINIKPRKDFSNLEQLVSEYLLYKHNEAAKSPPQAVYRRYNDIRQIGSKLYGTSGNNDRSLNYKYANNINNRQRPSIPQIRYGVQGFNYNKSPYISNLNDEHDQLSTDLYNLEEKSEDFAFNDNVNENLRIHNWDIASKYDNLRSTKQIRHDNPMDYSKALEYATKKDIPSNMAYYERTKVQRPFTRPVTRIQNPYSHPYSTNHYDYSKDHRNNQQVKSRSMLMKLANDENHDSQTLVYGYNRRQNRPNDGKNDVRNYYLDRLKHIRPYKRPNSGYGDSSEFQPRHQRGSDELRADKQHFYIPDRANRDHGF